MTKETVKKVLAFIASTILAVFTTEAGYKVATGVDMIPGQIDHILGIVGILVAVLSRIASLDKFVFGETEPPKDPPA